MPVIEWLFINEEEKYRIIDEYKQELKNKLLGINFSELEQLEHCFLEITKSPNQPIPQRLLDAKSASLPALKNLLKTTDARGWTLLHTAIYYKHTVVAQHLVALAEKVGCGYQINYIKSVTKDGASPVSLSLAHAPSLINVIVSPYQGIIGYCKKYAFQDSRIAPILANLIINRQTTEYLETYREILKERSPLVGNKSNDKTKTSLMNLTNIIFKNHHLLRVVINHGLEDVYCKIIEEVQTVSSDTATSLTQLSPFRPFNEFISSIIGIGREKQDLLKIAISVESLENNHPIQQVMIETKQVPAVLVACMRIGLDKSVTMLAEKIFHFDEDLKKAQNDFCMKILMKKANSKNKSEFTKFDYTWLEFLRFAAGYKRIAVLKWIDSEFSKYLPLEEFKQNILLDTAYHLVLDPTSAQTGYFSKLFSIQDYTTETDKLYETLCKPIYWRPSYRRKDSPEFQLAKMYAEMQCGSERTFHHLIHANYDAIIRIVVLERMYHMYWLFDEKVLKHIRRREENVYELLEKTELPVAEKHFQEFIGKHDEKILVLETTQHVNLLRKSIVGKWPISSIALLLRIQERKYNLAQLLNLPIILNVGLFTTQKTSLLQRALEFKRYETAKLFIQCGAEPSGKTLDDLACKSLGYTLPWSWIALSSKPSPAHMAIAHGDPRLAYAIYHPEALRKEQLLMNHEEEASPLVHQIRDMPTLRQNASDINFNPQFNQEAILVPENREQDSMELKSVSGPRHFDFPTPYEWSDLRLEPVMEGSMPPLVEIVDEELPIPYIPAEPLSPEVQVQVDELSKQDEQTQLKETSYQEHLDSLGQLKKQVEALEKEATSKPSQEEIQQIRQTIQRIESVQKSTESLLKPKKDKQKRLAIINNNPHAKIYYWQLKRSLNVALVSDFLLQSQKIQPKGSNKSKAVKGALKVLFGMFPLGMGIEWVGELLGISINQLCYRLFDQDAIELTSYWAKKAIDTVWKEAPPIIYEAFEAKHLIHHAEHSVSTFATIHDIEQLSEEVAIRLLFDYWYQIKQLQFGSVKQLAEATGRHIEQILYRLDVETSFKAYTTLQGMTVASFLCIELGRYHNKQGDKLCLTSGEYWDAGQFYCLPGLQTNKNEYFVAEHSNVERYGYRHDRFNLMTYYGNYRQTDTSRLDELRLLIERSERLSCEQLNELSQQICVLNQLPIHSFNREQCANHQRLMVMVRRLFDHSDYEVIDLGNKEALNNPFTVSKVDEWVRLLPSTLPTDKRRVLWILQVSGASEVPYWIPILICYGLKKQPDVTNHPHESVFEIESKEGVIYFLDPGHLYLLWAEPLRQAINQILTRDQREPAQLTMNMPLPKQMTGMDNDGLDSGYWMLYNLLLLHRSVESKTITSPAFGKDSSVAGKMRSLFSRQLTKVAEQRTETSRKPSKEEISDEEAEQEEIGGKVEPQPIHHQYDPNNNNHNSYGQMQGLIGEQGPMNDQAQGVSFDMMGLFEELNELRENNKKITEDNVSLVKRLNKLEQFESEKELNNLKLKQQRTVHELDSIKKFFLEKLGSHYEKYIIELLKDLSAFRTTETKVYRTLETAFGDYANYTISEYYFRYRKLERKKIEIDKLLKGFEISEDSILRMTK